MSHVFTGTATDWGDLLDQLRANLTNASLMGSEAWTEVGFDNTSVVNERFSYLQGPGLAGTDQIHVNIRQYKNVGSDYYNWQVNGSVAYNPLQVFALQPGVSPPVVMPLWQSSIPYTLVASGRRFILTAKISTVYMTLYAGFILPYATPSEMPYPMYIAGPTVDPATRWSRGTYFLGAPWDPVAGGAYIRHFDGSWPQVSNFAANDSTVRNANTVNCVWPWEADYTLGQNQDATYGTLPAILHGSYAGGNAWGELDGIVWVTGTAMGSEDTVTVGSDTYEVIQSTYRTGRVDYAAIKQA